MDQHEHRESRHSQRKLSNFVTMLSIKDPRQSRSPSNTSGKDALSSPNPSSVSLTQSSASQTAAFDIGRVLVNIRYKTLEQSLEVTIMDVTDLKPDTAGLPRRNAMTARITVLSDVIDSPRATVPHGRLFAGGTRKTCDFTVSKNRLKSDVVRIELLRDGTTPYAEAYLTLVELHRKHTESCDSSDSTSFRMQTWHRLLRAQDPLFTSPISRCVLSYIIVLFISQGDKHHPKKSTYTTQANVQHPCRWK